MGGLNTSLRRRRLEPRIGELLPGELLPLLLSGTAGTLPGPVFSTPAGPQQEDETETDKLFRQLQQQLEEERQRETSPLRQVGGGLGQLLGKIPGLRGKPKIAEGLGQALAALSPALLGDPRAGAAAFQSLQQQEERNVRRKQTNIDQLLAELDRRRRAAQEDRRLGLQERGVQTQETMASLRGEELAGDIVDRGLNRLRNNITTRFAGGKTFGFDDLSEDQKELIVSQGGGDPIGFFKGLLAESAISLVGKEQLIEGQRLSNVLAQSQVDLIPTNQEKAELQRDSLLLSNQLTALEVKDKERAVEFEKRNENLRQKLIQNQVSLGDAQIELAQLRKDIEHETLLFLPFEQAAKTQAFASAANLDALKYEDALRKASLEKDGLISQREAIKITRIMTPLTASAANVRQLRDIKALVEAKLEQAGVDVISDEGLPILGRSTIFQAINDFLISTGSATINDPDLARVDTLVDLFVAEYLKGISGTQVTDVERENIKKVLMSTITSPNSDIFLSKLADIEDMVYNRGLILTARVVDGKEFFDELIELRASPFSLSREPSPFSEENLPTP